MPDVININPLTDHKLIFETLNETRLKDSPEEWTGGTPEERDLFTSLRGFQLRSDIEVVGIKKGELVTVMFKKWLDSLKKQFPVRVKENLILADMDMED